MEAGFLGAAAAPEPQVRRGSLELNRARAVLIPPPAVGGRADFFGVDSEQFLRAAAAARASERCGPGHGETMRARTLPARSALPLHLSRTLFPTSTDPRSSLTCGQTTRVHDMAFTAQRWAVGYLRALRTLRARAGRHAEVERRTSAYACHMFCAVFVPRARACTRGLVTVSSAIIHVGQVWLQALMFGTKLTFQNTARSRSSQPENWAASRKCGDRLRATPEARLRSGG